MPTPVRLYSDSVLPPAVAATFADVREHLGIPWTPHLLRALAAHPAYLELIWPQLSPNVEQRGFAMSAAFIADRALDFIRDIYEPTYSPAEALAAVGDGERDLRQTLAALRYGLPQVMLLGGALLEALKFEKAGGKGRPGDRERTDDELAIRDYPVHLVADDEAPSAPASVYAEIREATGLPFVPCELQAVARWPDYLRLAWNDLRYLLPHPWYRRRRRSLSYYAAGGTHYLAIPVYIGRDSVERAGLGPADIEDLKSLLQLFAATLPGQLLNVVALQHALDPRPPEVTR